MRQAQPRRDALWMGAAIAALLVALLTSRWWLGDTPGQMHFDARLTAPSPDHWLGTDALGRDLWARTLAGLSLSIGVGSLAALIGTLIALGMAMLAMLGPRWDALVALVIDTLLSVPHLILLLLIAFALGGGTQAVIIAVSVTHWPRLARLLRAEFLQLRHAPYITMSKALGKSQRFVMVYHYLPQVLSQGVVGALLLFPHAILHEAALTFLGVGLDPSQPAIGLLLADAMRYLGSGVWWLGLFPGLGLLLVVLSLERLASHWRHAL